MHDRQDALVVLLLFTTASLGVVAASDFALPLVRLVAASIAAGCAAVLAVLRPAGSRRP